MCGNGILFFDQNRKYVGEFQYNMLHGKGTMITLKEDEIVHEKGVWRKGE